MKTPEWKEQTDKVKASKGLIKIRYNSFKINWTRSGSDRIVLEHFDLLKQWKSHPVRIVALLMKMLKKLCKRKQSISWWRVFWW